MLKLSRSLATTALALSAVTALGQSQSINGTIRGQVTDVTGAPVPNTVVLVKNTDNGYVRQITTDNDGRYIAPNLPIGTYSVTATSSSFAPLMQNGIRVGAGTDSTMKS
jgi:protocatechuate 3,4-dioxygenase beta subunit